MRAIGYHRGIDGGPSQKELERAFYDYCDLELHQAVRTFSDTEDMGLRPPDGYRGMLAYISESGDSFLVVVPNSRHLGRDVEMVVRRLVELDLTGAKVTCADEEFPDPIQNALQTLAVRGVSRSRSQSIREAMRARAATGRGVGRPPYGYRNDTDGAPRVVPEEAGVVRLIYRLYANDGLGLRLVTRHLNTSGIRTRRGGQWNMSSVRDILRNPVYIGSYTRFGLRLPKNHEPIVRPKDFRAARDRADSRGTAARTVEPVPFLLSGLVYCDYCGNKMMGVTRNQRWRRKDGRSKSATYRYYQCQSRNSRSTCRYNTRRAADLENAVVARLPEVFGGDGSGVSHERRPSLPDHVANAQRRFIRATRRAAAGEISFRSLRKRLAELDTARGRETASATPAGAADTLAAWDSLPFDQRREFLRERVARVLVKDDGIEVQA